MPACGFDCAWLACGVPCEFAEGAKVSNVDLVEANRDRLIVWAEEGKSCFWMAMRIGLSDRSASAVSVWFRKQGIYRKAVK